MKKLIFFFALLLATVGVSAQTTRVITGYVTDSNGNAIPGAMVVATGGAEGVYTDVDGSFTIEVSPYLKSLTAMYAGLSETKYKLTDSNDIVIEMAPKKQKGAWFLNLVGSAACLQYYNDKYSNGKLLEDTMIEPQAGLMFGYMGNWGFYIKVQTSLANIATPFSDRPYSATIGLIKKAGPIYLYLGGGYATILGEKWGDSISSDSNVYLSAAKIDVGLMYRYKHFNIGVGYSYASDFSDWNEKQDAIDLTIGICF